ncbi:MAG: hypothetical protein Q9225_004279 [Loekoesia sp. 1 TL-2023]
MVSFVAARDRAKNIPRSKDVPWFQSKIGSSLTPAGRRLLEEYSGIASHDVETHIYKIRDIAWEIFPWPCVGEFWFITLGLSLHPSYKTLLSRLSLSSPAPKFLDLGTCVGQDLRKLVADGAPKENLYGADLFPEYESIGHQMFRDTNRFKNRFITADIFDDSVDGLLAKTGGTWDIVNIIMVLHIWDRPTQYAASKRILKLLKNQQGSMIIGAQTGSIEPGELVLKPPFVAEGEERSIYRHSIETFIEMWKDIEKEADARLEVKVEYDDPEARKTLAKEEESGERSFFFKRSMDQRRLFFTVQFL